jgi:hypothetical protein
MVVARVTALPNDLKEVVALALLMLAPRDESGGRPGLRFEN